MSSDGTISLGRMLKSPAILLALGLYLAVRCLTWWNAPDLEDHDSIWYLTDARAIAEQGASALTTLSPDTSPGYPVLAALVARIVGDVELGARLTSLAMSLLLLAVVCAIMRRWSDSRHTAYALLLIAVSPPLVRLSYSVLSEPTYIALVYLGWWVLLKGVDDLRWWRGLIAGAIFGLAFLTRFEAIVYLLGVPLLLLLDALITRGQSPAQSGRRWQWLAAFATAFILIIAPQVTRVSQQMGEFSLNGRELWFQILNAPDGRTYEEKLYGLDFAPGTINLTYLQQHPKARPQVTRSVALSNLGSALIKNIKDFYHQQLGEMAGPLVVVFFVCGLLGMIGAGQLRWAVQALAFLAISIAAPLAGVALPRHLAIMLPCALMVAGIGIGYLADATARAFGRNHSFARIAAMLWLGIAMGFATLELAKLNLRPDALFEAADYRAPAALVAREQQARAGEPVVIASRDKYFTYHVDATYVPLPFASYEKLVAYLTLNGVEFLFLEERSLEDQPFLSRFENPAAPADFDLLYAGKDTWGRAIRLYRFHRSRHGTAVDSGRGERFAVRLGRADEDLEYQVPHGNGAAGQIIVAEIGIDQKIAGRSLVNGSRWGSNDR